MDRTLLRPGKSPGRAAHLALSTARAMGLRTLLVSGRTYPELIRFARAFGDLDGIVAENGAVVEAPLGSLRTVVGRRRAERARRRLAGHGGLHCEFGEVVISAPRAERRQLRRAVTGLSVSLVPNVDRLMVVPEGVSKSTGTRRALRQLGFAHATYAAVGDGENDVALLRGASLSGAVANARPEVRRVADYVCRGRFDRGVLEFVRGPLSGRVDGKVHGRTVSEVRPEPSRQPRQPAC